MKFGEWVDCGAQKKLLNFGWLGLSHLLLVDSPVVNDVKSEYEVRKPVMAHFGKKNYMLLNAV